MLGFFRKSDMGHCETKLSKSCPGSCPAEPLGEVREPQKKKAGDKSREWFPTRSDFALSSLRGHLAKSGDILVVNWGVGESVALPPSIV